MLKSALKILGLTFTCVLFSITSSRAQEKYLTQVDKYVELIDANHWGVNYQHIGSTTDTLDFLLAEGYLNSGNRAGGFSQSTYHNAVSKVVYKIVFSDNLNGNLNRSYYFKDEHLIFANLELLDATSKLIRYSHQYFLDGALIKSVKHSFKLYSGKSMRGYDSNSLAEAERLLVESKKDLH